MAIAAGIVAVIVICGYSFSYRSSYNHSYSYGHSYSCSYSKSIILVFGKVIVVVILYALAVLGRVAAVLIVAVVF